MNLKYRTSKSHKDTKITKRFLIVLRALVGKREMNLNIEIIYPTETQRSQSDFLVYLVP